MNDELVKSLVEHLQKTQWTHKTDFEYVKKFSILTRSDLQKIEISKNALISKTSGSTGEPVTVEKTPEDQIWLAATNILDIIWRKWDVTKTFASIKPPNKVKDYQEWGLPKNMFPVQGKAYSNNMKPIDELQKWLEEKNPHYMQSIPSIINQIDFSKISNFVDCKTTSENGGTAYTSEECGTIALTCPDNPSVMHVMENIIVEAGNNGEAIITVLTNPHIKRYLIGDYVELGECDCGRTLQVIKEVRGRSRNMFVMPDGRKKWPLLGNLEFQNFGIKRYQAIQTSLNSLDLYIIADTLGDKEKDLINVVKKWLDSDINVTIKYVDSFPVGKFEDFKSLVN